MSTDGGTFPAWSRVRDELLYATPDNRINVVPESQNTAKRDKVVFVFNFFDELRRIAPAAQR